MADEDWPDVRAEHEKTRYLRRAYRGFSLHLMESRPGFVDVTWPHHVFSLKIGGAPAFDFYEPGRPDLTWQPDAIGMIPAGTPIRREVVGGHSYLFVTQSVDLFRRAAAETLDYDRIDFRLLRGLVDPVLPQIGHALLRLLEQAPEDVLVAESLSVALAARLMKLMVAREPGSPPYRSGLPKRQIRRALDYIEANFTRDIALSEIASAAALSPFHFARAFKASTGFSPSRYVMRRRVERAKQLLRDQQFTLADIAYACGFASQSHFTTVFRREVGVTPGRYRSQAAG